MSKKWGIKDYDIRFDDFLREVPIEPTKQEYTRLNDLDQTKHVLRFENSHAKKEEHKSLNRYINIHPYDYNRIILQEPVSDIDYINGSYINRPSGKMNELNTDLKMLDYSKYDNIKFLAMQGPLPGTCEHHWKAIFENDVDAILMLTSLVEKNKQTQIETVKCERYWPSKKEQCQFQPAVRYGDFEIMIMEEENIRPNLIKSTLYLIDTKSRNIKDEKVITHWQYTGWPDFGAPEDTSDIVTLVRELREFIKEFSKDNNKNGEPFSILVHCSAGVGRTGTFIALFKAMEDIDEKLEKHVERTEIRKRHQSDEHRRLNIFKLVLFLRSKRVKMVQSFAQYQYLYACIADYLKEVDRMSSLVDDYISMQNL